MVKSEGSFIWYELLTPDPLASKRFYDAVVGWDVEPQPSGDLDYRMIRRRGPAGLAGNAGGVMRLTDEMANHGARPMWLGYVGVGDVDASVAAAEAAGGATLMPPWDIPQVGRIAMITDPQGAPLYLMTPLPRGPDDASEAFSVDQPQHVRWNELATADPDGAVAFYARLLGWDQQGHMDMGPMGKYRFLQHDGVGIGAVMAKAPEMPASRWSYYIGVDDIGRAASAVTAGGGQILHGPIEIPGGEFSLHGIDPQQAAFGLVGPRL